jgi:translation initiation factor 1
MSSRKNRIGTVYSTNPDFEYKTEQEDEQDTLPNDKQMLYIKTDSKLRKGKTVTVISNFAGKTEDLETLSKLLKTKCGVGGSSKDGEIIIQGDLKMKIKEILEKEKYKTKIIN